MIEPQEISYDITKNLRLVLWGKALYLQERNGLQWISIARIDGPNKWLDAHMELRKYSREFSEPRALQSNGKICNIRN